MTSWDWKGSRWWKFDFHTHTPASDDYGKGPEQAKLKTVTPREWLLDFMAADIDCVAVTDHNTGAWVDGLKAALAELAGERPTAYRPLFIFPGMEISIPGGIHLLGIFDSEKTTADLDALRGAVGYDGTPGASDGVTCKSFLEVCQTITEAGGLAIPAHVDGPNSLFRLQGQTLKQVLDSGRIIAMELLDPTFRKPQIYLDGKLDWTEIRGSDTHHPVGIGNQFFPGSHFTWVKMSTPNLEGLRLALLDGPLSVRPADPAAGDPNQHPALAIEEVEIDRARYMGRGKPFVLTLNPWLNAVIGGRGTGKSTLLEFIRIALRRQGEIPDSLKAEFEKYSRVPQGRDDDGLLTEQSRLAVIYRKDRTRFRIQWNTNGTVEPIEIKDGNGPWQADQGDIRPRFPVRLYSQKQIYEMAKTPLALLRIIDEAPEVDRPSWDEQWKQEATRFLSLRAQAREIEGGLGDIPRLSGELTDISHQLAIYEDTGHAATLKGYKTRQRQRYALESWEKEWFDSGDRVRQLAANLVPDALDSSHFEDDRNEDRELLNSAATVRESLTLIRENLLNMAENLDGIRADWNTVRDESAWTKAVGANLEQYQTLIATLKTTAGDASTTYGELLQKRQAIEGRLKEMSQRRKQRVWVLNEAETSRTNLLKLRRELTERRRVFLGKVLADNPFVRIEVAPYGAHETMEKEFRALIQRDEAVFEKDIGQVDGEGLLGRLCHGSPEVGDFENRLAEMKKKVNKIAAADSTLPVADRRFTTHLAKLPPETFDRLDLWFPEDSLKVWYGATGIDSKFRPIQEGSPGQKTAAMLAFLLSHGDEPIILDQPEDDLDNHFIYDLIVTQIRRTKLKRQVIVVTHNANIVVNGDAELVVALAPQGGQTQLDCAGGLQEQAVREQICAVMEGGWEAFEKRYRRLAREGRHV